MTGLVSGRVPRTMAAAQGLYYVATGLWPLLSMPTFEAVTGRKRDRWLVRTVGLLAIAFGGLILRGARRTQPDPGPGLAGAAAFGTASLWYWGRGRLNDAYLLDSLAEAALLGAWLGVWWRGAEQTAGARALAPGRAGLQAVL